MAEHTYTKYLSIEGTSLATPEGAAMAQEITMDGLNIVKSVTRPLTPKERGE